MTTWTPFGADGLSGAASSLLGRPFDDVGDLSWEVPVGTFLVAGGRVRIAASSPTKSVALVAGMLPRSEIRARILFDPVSDNHLGVVVRMQPSLDACYLAVFERPHVHLFRVFGGTSEWIASELVNVAGGGDLQLEADGAFVRARWLDDIVIEYEDPDPIGDGLPGIQITAPFQWITGFDLEADEDSVTVPPSTIPGTTGPPTTPAPTTEPPATPTPTTLPEPTFPPTTTPTTAPTTTEPPLTNPETDPPATTVPPVTPPPLEDGGRIVAGFSYVESEDLLVVRSWLTNEDGRKRDSGIVPATCRLDLVDEKGRVLGVAAYADADVRVARFVFPHARLLSGHLYLARIVLDVDGGGLHGPAVFGLPVN